MTASSLSQPPAVGGRITRNPLVRIILACAAAIVPVAVVLILVHQIPDKSLRAVWPQLLAAALCAAGYLFYVRRIEGRQVTELSGPRQGRELAAGVGWGTGLFLVVIGALAALGSYRITGLNDWPVLAKPCAEMVLAATVEEIVFRGVLFRIAERSLGSWPALILSSAIFALAHLPNDGITALAAGATVVAGVWLAAAYMATKRLWLPIGLHFAWNFVSDGVFSLPTSGHPASGLVQGQLTGPEWLAGGVYGVEGSIVTVAVLAAAAAWLLRLAVRRGNVVRAASKQGAQ